MLDEGTGEALQFFKPIFPAELMNLVPESLLQQLERTVQRRTAAGFLDKGAHLLPGFQQLTVVVQVGVVNHAADIVGNISLQNGEKGIGGEKFHRAVQQLPFLLGGGADHLFKQQAAR